MGFDAGSVPRYADLPIRPDLPPGSSWGVFGDDDQLGTLNFLTAERRVGAARLVRHGKIFPLNWSMTLPGPPLFGRKPVKHRLGIIRDIIIDDVLHDFYPQASSQWDALRHVAHPQHGFYNGRKLEETSIQAGGALGIDAWARAGIVGRGILVDVAEFMRRSGQLLDGTEPFSITKDVINGVLEKQGVEVQAGDILLFRTGWLGHYLRLSEAERAELASSRHLSHPGLYGMNLVEYFWDNQIAAVAADNTSLELAPAPEGESLALHLALIPLIGMAIGELWFLEDLARDCASDGVYEFMLTSAPLNMPGAAGSPPNAIALK